MRTTNGPQARPIPQKSRGSQEADWVRGRHASAAKAWLRFGHRLRSLGRPSTASVCGGEDGEEKHDELTVGVGTQIWRNKAGKAAL